MQEVVEATGAVAPMTCMEKVQAYARFILGWFGLLDLILCLVNVIKSGEECSRLKTGRLGWILILQVCQFSLLLAQIIVCAVPRSHALFLDQPLLFLFSVFRRFFRHRAAGLRKALFVVSRRLDLRYINKAQGAVCVLVGAFFSAGRAAIVVNLVFNFSGAAVAVVLGAIPVLLQYLKFVLTQCVLCVAFRRLGMGTGKAICAGWVFATLIIYVMPFVLGYLIWTNKDEGMRVCSR